MAAAAAYAIFVSALNVIFINKPIFEPQREVDSFENLAFN